MVSFSGSFQSSVWETRPQKLDPFHPKLTTQRIKKWQTYSREERGQSAVTEYLPHAPCAATQQERMSRRKRRRSVELQCSIDMLCALAPYGHTLYGRPLQYRTNDNLSFTLLRNGLLSFGTREYLLLTLGRAC